MPNSIKLRLVAAFIALSLCATWFVFARATSSGNSHDSLTVYIFVADSHLHGHYDKLAEVWKPRIGGNWIAGRLCDAFAQDGEMSWPVYQNVFGFYNAAWLVLTFTALICLATNPLFVIPLIFAGMIYTLTPPDAVVITPWDLPSMFFWTLSFLLWQGKKYLWMLAVIVLGTIFKETVAVTAFLFFFTAMNWRRRWTYFGAAFIMCLLLKLWITHSVLGQAKIFTADWHGQPGIEVLTNFLSPQVNHFIWINAGTFALALCLPAKTREDMGTKFLLIAFFAGMTAACILANTNFEFRQFLDVLPLSVLYLERTIQLWKTNQAEPVT